MEISSSALAVKKSSTTYTYNWVFEENFGDLMAFHNHLNRPCTSETIQFKEGILASKSHCMKIFVGKDGDICIRISVQKGNTPLKDNDDFTHCSIYNIKPFIITNCKDDKPKLYDFELLQPINRLNQLDNFICKENESIYPYKVGSLCRGFEDRTRLINSGYENGYVPWKSMLSTSQKSTHLSFQIVIYHFYWNETQLLFSTNGTSPSRTNKGLLDTKPFYQSTKFSDFIIQCGNKEFPVHKIIIENKSSVFQTMFQQPLKEMETGRLVIEDTEPEIVEEFIRFLYTGEICKMEENAAGLLLIADKYAVEDLKLISENALIKMVNENNFLELYQLGTLVNSESLIDCCFQQFKRLKKDILKTITDIERFSKECPGLLLMLTMENI